MKPPTVFISYSHADAAFVDQLAADLQKNDLDVWIDKWQIRVGDSIVEKIDAGLARADFLVVVLSKSSVVSPWVRQELDAALVRTIESKVGAFLLPVVIEECDIPQLLRARMYADFQRDPIAALGELLTAIRARWSPADDVAVAARAPDVSSGHRPLDEIYKEYVYYKAQLKLEEIADLAYFGKILLEAFSRLVAERFETPRQSADAHEDLHAYLQSQE